MPKQQKKTLCLENSITEIKDDFDLPKIAASGQCFRVREFDDNMFRFITDSHVLYIRKLSQNTYAVRCEKDSWESVWSDYFDLQKNYCQLRKQIENKNTTAHLTGEAFIRNALQAGCGIRLLHQNAWEMLLTFIISQRKNIPAISKSIEILSAKYGDEIVTPYETVHAFPTPNTLSGVTEEDLRSCRIGYRAAYLMDAIKKVADKTLNLAALTHCSDEELFTELLKVHGVGKKVADCVCLYGYGRTSIAPVDVWIARAIEKEFQGKDPFSAYEDMAGILQQYIFYYMRTCL